MRMTAGLDLHSNAALRELALALALVSSSLSLSPAAAKSLSVPPAKEVLGAGAELGREDTAGSGCVTLGTLAIL